VVLPKVSVRDWRTREGVRALPGAGPSPTAALRRIAAAKDPLLRACGRSLTARVGILTEVREHLATVAAGGEKPQAERARALQARLLRHDTERALLAVYEESARHGSFDGMYAVVAELVRPRGSGGGPDALDVLMAILRDEPMPEDGIPPDRKRGYDFLEPLPPDGDPLTLRIIAAAALGDIGDAITGAELTEYFDEIAWNDRPDWQDDDRKDIDNGTTPKLMVAVACASLGELGPLRSRVVYLEETMKNIFRGSSLDRRQLAMAYGRLGEYAKAARQYRYCLRDTPRDAILRYNLACALARSGNERSSLEALRVAVTYGYGADPSQITWAWRDRDLASVRKLEGFRKLFGEPFDK
jgi:tetratricopeptide (TPR) repeat protein